MDVSPRGTIRLRWCTAFMALSSCYWRPAARVGICRESIRPANTSLSSRINLPWPPSLGHRRRQAPWSHRHSYPAPTVPPPRHRRAPVYRKSASAARLSRYHPPPPVPVGAVPVAGPPLPPGVTQTSVIGPPLVAVPVPQDRVVISPDRVMAPIGSEVVLRSGILTARGNLLVDRTHRMAARQRRGRPDRRPQQPRRVRPLQLAMGRSPQNRQLVRHRLDRKFSDRRSAVIQPTPPATCRFNAAKPGSVSLRPPKAPASSRPIRPKSATGNIAAPSPRSIGSTLNGSSLRRPSKKPGRAHVLTTTVTRRSNGTPVPGWIVRYEVAGPGGSLGYSAGKSVDVTTDASGRASVEVSPTDVAGGVASVNMILVRPPVTAPFTSPQLEIARGAATITWGAARSP